VPAKKTSRTAFVEHAWKIVLQQMDKGRQRSGKALARQSEVHFLPIEEGRICARITSKGFDGGIYFVELPCIDNWNPRIDNLVFWFAHRLDILAVCLSGEWNDDFLAYLEEEGLHLFPDEQYAKRLQWEASCTCNSQDPVCKHVVGIIYKLIWEMESRPLRAIEFVCVDTQVLIDKVHLLVSKPRQGNKNLDDKILDQNKLTEDFFSRSVLSSEQLTYNNSEFSRDSIRARQMIPDLQPDDLKKNRNIYMAW
jgi:uncharacterized Zn finger protein